MTAQPTRDQLRALARDVLDGGSYLTDEEEIEMALGVRHLLDQLAAAERHRDHWRSAWRQRGIKHLAAEKRATRAEAQSAIRGRAVVVYRERARAAEARLEAIQLPIDRAEH